MDVSAAPRCANVSTAAVSYSHRGAEANSRGGHSVLCMLYCEPFPLLANTSGPLARGSLPAGSGQEGEIDSSAATAAARMVARVARCGGGGVLGICQAMWECLDKWRIAVSLSS